jgi:hypothetical protein
VLAGNPFRVEQREGPLLDGKRQLGMKNMSRRIAQVHLNAHGLHLTRTSNRNLPAILLGKRVRGAKE